jgi:hypothetical protein
MAARPADRDAARRSPFAGLLSLVVILAVLGVLLRVVHIGIPLFYPQVLQGPFSVDSLGEVEEYAGFSPLVPFYRPASLGSAPVVITVFRRPRPGVTILWQGEHLLVVEQTRGGEPPPRPPSARPLADDADTAWWREGRTHHVVTRTRGLWVEIRTDLPEQDLRRIVATLRPYAELL